MKIGQYVDSHALLSVLVFLLRMPDFGFKFHECMSLLLTLMMDLALFGDQFAVA